MRPSETSTGAAPCRSKIATRFCRAVVVIALGSSLLAVLAHDYSILFTSAPKSQFPMPLYGLWPAEKSLTRGVPFPSGPAGADYTQVYTSALALRNGQSAYLPESRLYAERWGRPPGYPPLMNWLNVPFTRLQYRTALMAHTLLSVLGLAGATALLFWRTRLLRHLGAALLAMGGFYFLTPVGITHLERGQFDLIVATAALLCVSIGLTPGRHVGLGLLVGVLGALKWTAIPFLGCYSTLGFLLGAGRRRWTFLLIPLITAAATFAFWTALKEYWLTITVYEIKPAPEGLTLQHLLPRKVTRMIPILMTLLLAGLVWIRARSPVQRGRAFAAVSAPFALALINVSVCYGTLSYEYHTVSILGMLPIVVVWAENVPWVSGAAKVLVSAVLALFLPIAFRAFGVPASFLSETITNVYAVTALVFWTTAGYIAVTGTW